MQDSTHRDGGPSALAKTIGQRVRDERVALGLTQDTLAQVSGVSRRIVINVEHGEANPSVGTLLRLADALGIGLPALMESPAADPVQIARAGQGTVLWTGEHGGTSRLLSGSEAPDVLEHWEWDLHPDEIYASDGHTPGTTEIIHVLTGSLIIEIGDRVVSLASGDSIQFLSDVPHRYLAGEDGAATFTMVVYEPGVGTPLHRAALKHMATGEA